MHLVKKSSLAIVLVVLSAASARAQSPAPDTDPMITALQDGNGYIRDMFTKAAAQMADGDYAFQPTPDVRSFGQIIAHVADSNYYFCSGAKGEKPPVTGLAKTKTSPAEIRAALAESFDYCDDAYGMASRTADKTIEFMGKRRSAGAILSFRNYHSLLHYGNVITYMRLKGKVPPSSQLPEPQ
jgi:uncharacterized damage-inducible protein DinB